MDAEHRISLKYRPKRPKEFSLGRPIGDGEHDFFERSRKRTFNRFAEILCRCGWIIVKRTAAPSAQHKLRKPIGPSHRQHPIDSRLEQHPRFGLAHSANYRACRRDKGQQPRLIQIGSVIGAKNGNIRRKNTPVCGIGPCPRVVMRIHRIPIQGAEQGTRPAKHLLLGPRAAQKPTPRVNTIGKVESQRPLSTINQSTACGQCGFIRNLNNSNSKLWINDLR